MEKGAQNKEQITKKIINALKDATKGLTIKELAEYTGISRNTISKYLDVLVAKGKVDVRKIGPAKVFYLSYRIPIQGILNFVHDGIILCTSDLKIVQINEKTIEILEIEEFRGKNLSEISLFNERKELLQGVKNTLKGKEVCFRYVPYALKNKTKYLHLIAIPITFETNETGVLIIIYDVTEYYIIRKKLEESEKRYRTLIENVPVFIVMIDKNEKIVYVNKYMLDTTGRKEEEIINRSIWEFVPKEYVNDIKNKKMLLFTTGKLDKVVVKAKMKSGAERYFEATGALVRINGDKYAMVMARDITEEFITKKENEENISIMYALHEIFLPKKAFIVITEDLKIKYSGGMWKHFKVKDEEIKNKNVSSIFDESFVNEVKKSFESEKKISFKIASLKTSQKKFKEIKGEIIPIKIGKKRYRVIILYV